MAQRPAIVAKNLEVLTVSDRAPIIPFNTHRPWCLYEAFPAEDAYRLMARFKWHYVPERGSWLNIAEIELSIMQRQCLSRRLDHSYLMEEMAVWEAAQCAHGHDPLAVYGGGCAGLTASFVPAHANRPKTKPYESKGIDGILHKHYWFISDFLIASLVVTQRKRQSLESFSSACSGAFSPKELKFLPRHRKNACSKYILHLDVYLLTFLGGCVKMPADFTGLLSVNGVLRITLPPVLHC